MVNILRHPNQMEIQKAIVLIVRNKSPYSLALFAMYVFKPMTTLAKVLFLSSTNLGKSFPSEKTRLQSRVSSNLASMQGPEPD